MIEQGRLVSWAEAEEQLAGMEAFLEEAAAPPASQRWDELVEVVDELRGDFG